MTKRDIENELINLMKSRVNAWKDARVYLTPNVVMNIKTLIEQCRKNYWGVFDKPIDTQTGQEKVWIPLTEAYTESSVKNTDTNTKDIKVKALNKDAYRLTGIFREALVNELDRIHFNDSLNDKERRKAIDGTSIAKVDVKSKKPVKLVDRLNFFINPTAESIQDTELIIERSIMTLNEIRKMDGWDNLGSIKPRKNVSPNNIEGQDNAEETLEVFELWGNIDGFYMSGKEDDKSVASVHAVIIDLFNNPVVALIEENPSDWKPYEEDWYIKVPGRWDGRGIPERLLMLQVWMNMVVNIRITRSRVNQLGLFKAIKGKGITAQSLSRLAVNGVIQVESLDDIEQFVMQDVPQSSYTEEENIRAWTERITHSFEIATGEGLPSTTTATIGAIQNSNSKTFYELVRQNSASFTERLIERHLFKDIVRKIKKKKTYMLALENRDLQMVDEAKRNSMAMAGQNPEDYDNSVRYMGNTRPIEFDDDFTADDFGTTVYMGNDKLDENVLITNLLNMLKVAPEYREQVIKEVFDILGLNFTLPVSAPMQAMPNQQMIDQPNSIQMLENANTINNPVTAYGQ